MSDSPDDVAQMAAQAPRPRTITALVALLWLESAALVVATIYLAIEIVSAPANSVASAIALAAVALIAAVWIGAIAINVLRGNAWVRGATVVVQVLIIALAVGSFQGQGANPVVGFALLVPALVVLALLFSRPVVAATARRER